MRTKVTAEVPVHPRWLVGYQAFSDAYQLPDDGLGLYAIRLRFGLDDPRVAAAESITGGNDDKKCDVVYLDRERGVAVVAQCYQATTARASAPANKASDLNTAVAWLLTADLAAVPEGLRPRAEELREALQSGDISELHIWYVHNLPESANVKAELNVAEDAARRHLQDSRSVTVFAREVGTATFSELYDASDRPIAVTEEFDLKIPDAIEVASGNWSSVLTVVPGRWLFDLFQDHREDLFSANVRDYLGSRASDANINNGIKSTASDSPEDFFIYNNGVTALVLDYSLSRRTRSGRTLTVRGVSIVNGAQTTGSLGNLAVRPSEDLRVAVRFVRCDDTDVVENLVRFNNSQNRIQAADFRSKDRIQERLRAEFVDIDGANYEGGRRGGASDAMRRTRAMLPSYTVGQVLTAFHGDPLTAYDKKSDIWVNDSLYSHVFNERTTAPHVVFCYSLLEAITTRQLQLARKAKANEAMTEAEQREYTFLRQKGANYLLVSAISRGIETILARPVANRFDLIFDPCVPMADAASAWDRVLASVLPFVRQLDPAFTRGRLAREELDRAVDQFGSMVEAMAATQPTMFQDFADRVSAN
jgi:hypothetical protein